MKCNTYELSNGLCKLDSDNNNNEVKDLIISNIKELISKGGFDNILLNITKENNKGIIIKDDNIIYQIVSTDNQNNSKEENISIIELGNCEKELRSHYNINKNEPLLIFKMDIYKEGSLTPIIEYEVYDSITKAQLNLSICDNTKINILIPIVLEEDNINKYNSSHEYYNDICYTYTTERGTDIILTDRKNEFISNNMSLCETKCEYGGYDSDIKKAKCECEVKIKIPLMSEITINSDILKKKIDIKKAVNIRIMKCFKITFSKKGLKNNVGNYIILSIIFIVTICLISFLIKGFSLLKEKINTIKSNDHSIEKSQAFDNNILLQSKEKFRNNKIVKKKKKKKRFANLNFEHNSNALNINNNETRIDNSNQKIDVPPPKNNRGKAKINQNKSDIKTNKEHMGRRKGFKNIKKNKTNDKEKDQKFNIETINNDISKNKIQNNNINLSTIKYNDFELNTLNYEVAIIIDKRSYLQYYLSLLKRKHILIFTFYTSDDYNSKEIKICLLFFSFALYFTVNALFFNDSTMHKIYEDNGVFNFIYQLPQIIYSTLISSIINILATSLSLSEKNILSIKNEKSTLERRKDVINRLIIKFTLFFVLIYILLVLFWYYVACFCAVYVNTQIHLIKDTLISYGLYLLYPFGLCLIPGIFRILSLSKKKPYKECLYKFSSILQLI